jgi:5'-nucleotidase / UDP-sugar diphosphatase
VPSRFLAVVVFGFGLFACSAPRGERLGGAVELVLLHSADTHSQLFDWSLLLSAADARLGLGRAGELARVGGFARLATLARRERAAAPRLLHLDSGDLFQGSLAFERFGGEPEILAFDALGVDAQALGNHELDHGAEPIRERYGRLATFPLLAANYLSEGPAGVGAEIEPFVVLDAAGLRVGVIGVGNVGSVAHLHERPNALGVVALEDAGAVQGAIDALRPLSDVIVAVTHLGLGGDDALVAATSGLDVVLGGHQHIVLDEPSWVADCAGARVRDAWGRERACAPRAVPIVHSGAYTKFLGKLTLALDDRPAALGTTHDPLDRHELTGLRFEPLPVHADIAEDPALVALLEPYRAAGFAGLALPEWLGFAERPLERNGATGGDSPLGNLAAEAVRRLAGAELAVLGSSSLRHDLPPGLIDAEVLARVLPFDDVVVRAQLSGAALERAFERAARSAANRECRSQVQVAGLLVRFTCPCPSGGRCAALYPTETAQPCTVDADCAALGGACSTAGRCFAPVVTEASYAVATTDYLAGGGSGLFEPISSGSVRTGGDVAFAVREALRHVPACAPKTDDAACDAGCARAAAARLAAERDGAGFGPGDEADLCARARGACAYLPCLDASAAPRDARVRFEAP